MCSYIDIQGKKYLYKVDYKGNEILRNSFNKLAKYNEYQYSINMVKEKSKEKVRKLNIDNTSDKDIFTEIINNKICLSKLYVKNNSFLIMFYCLDFMKENIYYIEDFNTVAICEYDKKVLYV